MLNQTSIHWTLGVKSTVTSPKGPWPQLLNPPTIEKLEKYNFPEFFFYGEKNLDKNLENNIFEKNNFF